jgi:N-hydroxyarylamine O-acetyltransferase
VGQAIAPPAKDQLSNPSLPAIYQRYLRILGFDNVPSGLDGLRTIVRAHLLRVPFENLSKLLLFASEGRGRFFTLPEFLDGIEHQDMGGTCYGANPFFGELLRALGYEADLHGANMPPRMNVHTSLRVRIDSRAYHVDVGYGGPFRGPIALDRLPFEMVEGANRYVLDREPQGEGYEMAVFTGEERVHGYLVHGPPRSLDFFTPAVQNSFAPTATFLNCIRICRFFDNHSVTLLNGELAIHRGVTAERRELQSLAEVESALVTELQMPRCPARAAIETMERISGKPLFNTGAARAESTGT